jgi:Fur family transcriptional regulator, ferric uptake regulator
MTDIAPRRDTDTFVNALDKAGYRLTRPRRQLADLVANKDGHFTAADLEAAARGNRLGVGRATIFRALDLFVELGLVERLDLPSGDHAYVRCEPAHHHHVICSGCGRSVDVEDCGMGRVAREVARQTGFRIDAHRLQLYGLCPDCSQRLRTLS